MDLQFGHLIVEHMTRLPQSLAERPDDLYLFTVKPDQTEDTLPAWVWQIMAWHGVNRRHVRLVTAPLTVAELHVAEQGEMMGKAQTGAAYLDLLDANMAARALVPEPAAVVFVTRAGMVAQGQGGHAGEAYLAQVVAAAGVRVVDPVRYPVAGQLAAYAGAQVLIFSEGSALHGRLLLGRLDQDVHILRRRPHRDLGAAQLAPRCRDLRYHATVGRHLGARMRGGVVRHDLTAALYDLEVVFDLFAGLGHDLRPLWDMAAYRAAVTQDLTGWFRHCRMARSQALENIALLAAAGFDIDPALATAPH